MDLFNVMIPVKSEPPQELQDLFRLFFFELAVCLATVFGGRIRPFADLIHIHGVSMETTSVNLLLPRGTCMEIMQLGVFPLCISLSYHISSLPCRYILWF